MDFFSMIFERAMNPPVCTPGNDEQTLPDWNDDSPVIASGYGYNTKTTWEVTEKGTMRWRYDPNGTGSGAYKTTAGWGNSIQVTTQQLEYMKVISKIRQIDIGENINSVYLGFAIKCERIRIREDLTSLKLVYFINLKEIICTESTIPLITYSNSYDLEKITIPDQVSVIPNQFAYNCYCLKEINNLEKIKSFGDACFNNTGNLCIDVIFSPDLIKIGNNAFNYSRIQSVTFQTPTNGNPSIHTNVFANCTNLTEVNLFDGWDMDLYVQSCPLTQESLHDIAEKYADMTGQTAPVLRIGANNVAKMDNEHIAMLDNKNIEYS